MEISLIARCVRRSHVRTRLLVALAKRRRAYAQLLAEDADIDSRDLRRAMRGELPYYTPVLSLVRLELVRQQRRGKLTEYEITPLGLDVVRVMRELRGRR